MKNKIMWMMILVMMGIQNVLGICTSAFQRAIVFNATSYTFIGCNGTTWNILG